MTDTEFAKATLMIAALGSGIAASTMLYFVPKDMPEQHKVALRYFLLFLYQLLAHTFFSSYGHSLA